jgi:GNAT superfamily N-acetyltransferase
MIKLSKITFQEEQLKDFIPEFDALLRPHMSEINMTQRYGFEFKPNYLQYIKMQEFGATIVLTCRNDDELIGYAVFNIYPSIRYPDCKMAREDLYYIKPEFRGNGLGKRLFIEIEKFLKEKDVDQVVFTTKTYQDYSHIFESIGYEFYEKHFIKKL